MNSKMIAIIAVVAMCGAALVGVGYAYTASYSPAETTIGVSDANYITIKPTQGASGVGTWTAIGEVDYDTVTSADGNTITYTPVGADSDEDGDDTKLTKTIEIKYQVTIDFTESGVNNNSTVTLNVDASAPKYSDSSTVKNVTFGSVTIKDGVTGGTKASDSTITVTSNGSTVDVTLYLVCDVEFAQETDPAQIQTDAFNAISTVKFSITA